ncbi:MAG TPA: hypothetical protein VGI74_03340 [Streptosporangiaceae bacterium]|jgi:hypothetical protein
MRTKPLVGQKAWFGPRRLGWGLGPVSPEGWAVLMGGAAVAIVTASVERRARWIALIVVAVMLLIVSLKGTSPGGPREWEEFNAARGNNGNS